MTLTKPTDSVRLFERRRWRRRVSDNRKWIIAAAIVAVLAFAVWAVFASSWFAVRVVQVQGTGVSHGAVRSAADVSPGTPLMRISLSAVTDRVEKIPAVRTASVQRSWPHTLVISVKPRRPVGEIQHNGAWWSIDDTGVLFHRTASPVAGRAVVDLQGTPAPGTRREVAAVLGALTPQLRAVTKTVTASSLDSITLHLSGGAQVRWGTADQSALKARVLHALMLHHHASFYDVSIPSEPAIRGF